MIPETDSSAFEQDHALLDVDQLSRSAARLIAHEAGGH
jgi:hypothetical protein